MSQSKIRIAVTGAGGGVGQSIIKALHGTDYEVVALDGEVLGAGLYATTRSHVIPYANSPKFIYKLLEICKTEDCKFLFPGLDAELPALSKAAKQFEDVVTHVVISSPDVIAQSDDKLKTYEILNKNGLAVPHTVDMSEVVDEGATLPIYPFILKKREGGARSKDTYLIKDEKSFKNVSQSRINLSEFVAQEYIDGDEYTCGTVNLDGDCQGVIVMRRILRDGDTYKCFSVKNEAIESYVRKIMAIIKPFGACNVQLRLKNNQPYAFEINARCSGTTAARALCGFNEPKMIADYLLFKKKPEFNIVEQTVLRYWKELVVGNSTVTELEKTGAISNNSPVPL